MRVALVIERFLPDGGGMEGVAWHVAHGLAKAGDEVHVVAREVAETAALTTHRVQVPSGWQPLRVVGFARGAARLTAASSFDVVHAFSRTLEQDVYRAGGGSHADYMLRAYPPAARALRRLTPRHLLLLSLERRIFERTRIIQCGSLMVKREIEARFHVPPDRLRVIYNGVDSERFRPDAAPARDLPARAAGPVWLFAGSGWRRKGLDTALRALARSRSSTAQLWIAGRDDDARGWRAQAGAYGVADRVEFLGERRDLENVYPAVDGLILPSRYDAFANVCLEAASSGLPVVTSATNGSSELFSRAGFIIDSPEDEAGFADALDRLSDPDTSRALAEEARRVALAHTWNAHTEELRSLYRELHGAPGRALEPVAAG